MGKAERKSEPFANTGYSHTFLAQSKFPDVIYTSMEPEEELDSTLKRVWGSRNRRYWRVQSGGSRVELVGLCEKGILRLR